MEKRSSSLAEKIVFEKMKESDIDEVLDIEKSSFPMPWTRQMFYREVCEFDFSFYFVGKIKDEIIGYAGFWLVDNEAHIGNFAVKKKYRQRYMGSRFMDFLLSFAVEKKVKLATLEVRASNEVAKSFYEKHGFKLIAVRKRYYSNNNEDAFVYLKGDLRRGI